MLFSRFTPEIYFITQTILIRSTEKRRGASQLDFVFVSDGQKTNVRAGWHTRKKKLNSSVGCHPDPCLFYLTQTPYRALRDCDV
jgi:hypothetical protein